MLARISEISQTLKQKIAFLDISNAWQIGYMGHGQTIKLVDSFRAISKIDAQLILTYQSSDLNRDSKMIFKYANMQFAGGAIAEKDFAALLGHLERLDPSRRSFPADGLRPRRTQDF